MAAERAGEGEVDSGDFEEMEEGGVGRSAK